MRRSRLLLGGLLGFLILLVAAVWLLPSLLDWNRYRSSFELLASATVGRPVAIEGPITLSLLPEPVLTAAKVSIGEEAGLESGSMSVGAMRLRVALGPLLGGHIDARELVLRDPALRLPWPLPAGAVTARPAAWITAFSARVENGRVRVGDLDVTGIDAALGSAETGAVSAAGSAHLAGRALRFTARLTSPGADGAAGLDLAMDGQGALSGAGATFSGQLVGDGSLAGRLAGRGLDLSQLMPAPVVPFRAEGRLTAGGGLVAADDLALEIGGSPARGAATLRLSPAMRLDVALAASRIDLNAWLPVLLRGSGTDMPVGLDLSAEGAPLAGGLLRQLRAGFELRRDGAILHESSAVLPGEASLHLAGEITSAGAAGPAFKGDARLEAPALRTTLEWLPPGPVIRDLPADMLRRASLTAQVTANPSELGLDQVHGQLDGAEIDGVVALRQGPRPAVGLDLTVDKLDLQAWLGSPGWPKPASLARSVALARSVSEFDADLRLAARQATLRGERIDNLAVEATAQDGNIQLRRLTGVVRGVRVTASGALSDAGRSIDGRVELATGDAALLADLVPEPWRGTPQLWQAPAAASLTVAGSANVLGLRLGIKLGDARLEAQPTLDPVSGKWTSAVTLRHPGARRLVAALGLLPSGGDQGQPARLDPARLDPEWLGDGSLSLIAQLSGEPGRIAAEGFDLTAGTLRASGQLAVDLAAAPPRVTGAIAADPLPLPAPVAHAPDPLPLDALRGWQASVHLHAGTLLIGLAPTLRQLACTLTVADGGLRLESLTARMGNARMGDGELTGSAALTVSAGVPALSVEASLRDASLSNPLLGFPLDLASGRLEAKLQLSASGYSPAAMLASAGGRLQANVTDGMLAGFDLAQVQSEVAHADPIDFRSLETALHGALSSGATAFRRLELNAEAQQGDVRLHDTRLMAGSGEVAFTGGVSLPGNTVELRAALRPSVTDSPEIALRFAGPIEAPQQSTEFANLAIWLASRSR